MFFPYLLNCKINQQINVNDTSFNKKTFLKLNKFSKIFLFMNITRLKIFNEIYSTKQF